MPLPFPAVTQLLLFAFDNETPSKSYLYLLFPIILLKLPLISLPSAISSTMPLILALSGWSMILPLLNSMVNF